MGRNDELISEVRQLVQPWLDELRRTITSSKTTNERGAHRVSFTSGTSSGIASTVSNELKGYSFRETTGGAGAVVELLDGTNNSGDVVATISLTAGESVRDWFSETGIALIEGLFVNVVSGSVRGAIYLRSGGAT